MKLIECECVKCGKFFIPRETWDSKYRLSNRVKCPICTRYSRLVKINGNGD